MMNPMPLFIRLCRNNVEIMINIWNISAIIPYSDTMTEICINGSEKSIVVGESYAEIQKKLLNVAIIL